MLGDGPNPHTDSNHDTVKKPELSVESQTDGENEHKSEESVNHHDGDINTEHKPSDVDSHQQVESNNVEVENLASNDEGAHASQLESNTEMESGTPETKDEVQNEEGNIKSDDSTPVRNENNDVNIEPQSESGRTSHIEMPENVLNEVKDASEQGQNEDGHPSEDTFHHSVNPKMAAATGINEAENGGSEEAIEMLETLLENFESPKDFEPLDLEFSMEGIEPIKEEGFVQDVENRETKENSEQIGQTETAKHEETNKEEVGGDGNEQVVWLMKESEEEGNKQEAVQDEEQLAKEEQNQSGDSQFNDGVKDLLKKGKVEGFDTFEDSGSNKFESENLVDHHAESPGEQGNEQEATQDEEQLTKEEQNQEGNSQFNEGIENLLENEKVEGFDTFEESGSNDFESENLVDHHAETPGRKEVKFDYSKAERPAGGLGDLRYLEDFPDDVLNSEDPYVVYEEVFLRHYEDLYFDRYGYFPHDEDVFNFQKRVREFYDHIYPDGDFGVDFMRDISHFDFDIPEKYETDAEESLETEEDMGIKEEKPFDPTDVEDEEEEEFEEEMIEEEMQEPKTGEEGVEQLME